MNIQNLSFRQSFLKNEIEKNVLLRRLDLAKQQANNSLEYFKAEQIEQLITFINQEKASSMEVFRKKLNDLNIFQ